MCRALLVIRLAISDYQLKEDVAEQLLPVANSWLLSPVADFRQNVRLISLRGILFEKDLKEAKRTQIKMLFLSLFLFSLVASKASSPNWSNICFRS